MWTPPKLVNGPDRLSLNSRSSFKGYEHAIIEYGTGVYLEKSTPFIDNSSINNNTDFHVTSFRGRPGQKIQNMILKFDEIVIYVSKSHLEKLKGSVIGWKDTLMESGFDIDNPQARQPCGCGESINFIEEESDDRR